MTSKKTSEPAMKKAKTTSLYTITSHDSNLITTRYEIKRIDSIYSELKKFLNKYKGNPKDDLLTISEEMFGEIYSGQNPGINNNLYNLEVLLAVLRYLSRTKRPYNKKRIILLQQFIFISEQNAYTNIFKSSSFKTTETYITVKDIEYFKIAKEYLKKISQRFNDINTKIFTDYDGKYQKDQFITKPENRYNIYFIGNTLVRIFIENILKTNLNLQSQSYSKSSSSRNGKT